MQKADAEHTKYFNSKHVEVPSCTTIVKLLNKPELVGWANYMGFRRIDVTKYLRERARYGTECHDIAEQYLTGIVYNTPPSNILSLNLSEYRALLEKLKYIQNVFDDVLIEVVQTEMVLHGERYGGTLDLLCRNKNTGDFLLFDFKTSKSVYESHLIQLAGYTMLLEELHGICASKIGVILLSKEVSDKKFVTVLDRKMNLKNEQIFTNLLDIYWIQKG